MFNLATKLPRRSRALSQSSPVLRLFSTKLHEQFKPNPVALQMIDDAFSLRSSARTAEKIRLQYDRLNSDVRVLPDPESQKSELYGQSLLALEQCESNQLDDNSKALLLLAMSTILSERRNSVEAIQKLNTIKDLQVSYFPLRVAAAEGLAGLHLELGDDDTSAMILDGCLNDLKAIKPELGNSFQSLAARLKSLKGLIELARGNTDLSQTCFKGVKKNLRVGNVALSYAEFLHSTRDFTTAKKLYQKIIKGVPKNRDFSDLYYLPAGNMTHEDTLLAATCSLGQLESHMGNFFDAQKILVEALTLTEDRFGPSHPKIGAILTCVALMSRHLETMKRGTFKATSLYRWALKSLEASELATEGRVDEGKVYGQDIIALAIGGFSEKQLDKAKGEQMKTSAEAAWKNRRLSLADALDTPLNPSSPISIIDTRISRAL